MPRQRRGAAVPQRIPARPHDGARAGARRDRPHGRGGRRAPGDALGRAGRPQREGALAADQHFRALDERARSGGEAVEPVLADADDRQPHTHHMSSPLSALTAAAASALPPRRPASATKGRPSAFAASAALASAAPTKPTGNPSTSAGSGAPAAIISSR